MVLDLYLERTRDLGIWNPKSHILFLYPIKIPALHQDPWCVNVNEVGVDVEGDKAKRLEGGRVHDGHVIGRVDAHSGHIGPSTWPNVRPSLFQNLPTHKIQVISM